MGRLGPEGLRGSGPGASLPGHSWWLEPREGKRRAPPCRDCPCQGRGKKKKPRAQRGSWQLPPALKPRANPAQATDWGAEGRRRRIWGQRPERSVTPKSVTAGQLRTDQPGAAQFARVPRLPWACERVRGPASVPRGDEEGPWLPVALL